MINKKIVFSLFTVPVAIYCHEAGDWQNRRKVEKEHESTRRQERLNSEAVDLTPQNGKFAFSGLSDAEIEEKYGFRHVKIKGVLDLEKEFRVKAKHRGEEGFFIVNPLYTHVNENKEPCGIMVNRGFLNKDFKQVIEHKQVSNDGYFEGVLYTGDKLTKYDFTSTTST